MLVLSRSEGEGIVVPDLDVAIRILQVAGSRVRIGVEAPESIRVLRTELAQHAKAATDGKPSSGVGHELRNRLNKISLALTIAEKQLQRGNVSLAEAALEDAFSQLTGKNSDRHSNRNDHAVVKEVRPPYGASQPSKLSVLLVEDNGNERSLLSEVLRLSGITVRTACNGTEALQRLQESVADVVLLDMHMPECDGPTTVQRIRADKRFDSVAIYAVTGASSGEVDVPRGEDGVREWFQKPVQTNVLIDVLRANHTETNACCAS